MSNGIPTPRHRWVYIHEGSVLCCDDFTHDVFLRMSGDFADDEQKAKYGHMLADKLNSSASSETKDTRDARVAPEMMSEAENRSGQADRERTASSGKPEQSMCRVVVYDGHSARCNTCGAYWQNIENQECPHKAAPSAIDALAKEQKDHVSAMKDLAAENERLRAQLSQYRSK